LDFSHLLYNFSLKNNDFETGLYGTMSRVPVTIPGIVKPECR